MSNSRGQLKSSAVWLFLGNFINRALSMISMIVVARILDPQDFGIVALATAVWAFFTTVFSAGVEAAVIHYQKHELEFLETAFWINLTFTAMLLLLTVLIAEAASSFYQVPELVPVLYIFAVGYFFTSLMQVHNAIITREMAFKTLSIFNAGFQLLDSAGMIALAVSGAGYWSLVLPKVILAPFKTYAWWRLCHWRPRFAFSWEHARSILRYSLNLMGATLMNYININADYLIVGKMLGQARLGLYYFAYNLANWPIHNFVFMVNRLAFPYYTSMKEDLPRMRERYLKMIQVVSVVLFPVFIGAAIVAPEGLPLIFGQKWEQSVFVFQVLCLFGMIRSVGSPGGQVMLALGRPEILLRFNLIQAPVLVGAILYSTRYGIPGVALATLIVLGTTSIIFIGLTCRLINSGYASFFKSVMPALASSSVMAAAVFLLKHLYYLYWDSTMILLIAAILIAVPVYLAVLAMGFRTIFQDSRGLIVSSLKEFIDTRGQSFKILDRG